MIRNCDSLNVQILSVQYRYRDPSLCTYIEACTDIETPVIPISRLTRYPYKGGGLDIGMYQYRDPPLVRIARQPRYRQYRYRDPSVFLELLYYKKYCFFLPGLHRHPKLIITYHLRKHSTSHHGVYHKLSNLYSVLL